MSQEYNQSLSAVDLVHGVQYVMTLEYRDYLANVKETAFSPESVMTFDTFTEAVSVSAPPDQYTFKEAFVLSFNLPEDASAGTVKLVLEGLVAAKIILAIAKLPSR